MDIKNIVSQDFIDKIIPLVDEKAKVDLGVGQGYHKAGIDKKLRDLAPIYLHIS